MENQYVKQFPEMLKGKTMMYVHGFGSSGQSGTVKRLRTVFPNTKVVAPDLPVHPAEAQELLRKLCAEEKPQLILGTSMGGMYTEQLYGFDRICINPALCIADTMAAHGMTGIQQFQNPRQDGVQEFYVDKAMVKEYREVSEHRFSGLASLSPEALDEECRRVFGLFGDRDDVVDTFDLFQSHYPQAAHFHGEHRMDDRSFMHAVVPVIRWIDDRQEGRERPIVYIGMESLSPTLSKGKGDVPRIGMESLSPTLSKGKGDMPRSSAQKAVRMLIEYYQVYFVAPLPWGGDGGRLILSWLEEYVNVPAWRHTIFTDRRQLLYGDYLIEMEKTEGAMATRIAFGSDTFKTWDDIIDYFALLGGQ